MRARRLTVAGGLAAVATFAPAALAGAAECGPDLGAFTPGTWRGHAFHEFNRPSELGVIDGYRELRFDVTFDDAGVVTGGSFAISGWAANIAFDSESGSETTWSFGGTASGISSVVQFDGAYEQEMVIAQGFTDLSGQGQVGYETGSLEPREMSIDLSPDAADCSMAVGYVTDPGWEDPVRWTAVRAGSQRGANVADRYDEITARAAALLAAEEFEADEIVQLLRDLIAVTRTLATLDSCATGRVGGSGSPQHAYARAVLQGVLARFASALPSFGTATIIRIMSLGFQAAGLQAQLCDGTYVDEGGIITALDAEMAERLRRSIVDPDQAEFDRIAVAAHQFRLPQTLAMLEQMGVADPAPAGAAAQPSEVQP